MRKKKSFFVYQNYKSVISKFYKNYKHNKFFNYQYI